MSPAMTTAAPRTIACLGLALWSTAAAAERRIMTSPAFGCPSAYETSRVLEMRREGLRVDGHVSEEADKASRDYMAEHKCRFLKQGDLVQFEWSNVERLEPATLGRAVCIRVPEAEGCVYAPKNFAESRSAAAPEEAPREAPATAPGPKVATGAATEPTPPLATPAPPPGSPTMAAPRIRPRERSSNRIELSPL
jgi:hypothetical protein